MYRKKWVDYFFDMKWARLPVPGRGLSTIPNTIPEEYKQTCLVQHHTSPTTTVITKAGRKKWLGPTSEHLHYWLCCLHAYGQQLPMHLQGYLPFFLPQPTTTLHLLLLSHSRHQHLTKNLLHLHLHQPSFLRQLSRQVALSFLYSLLCAVARVFAGTGGIAKDDMQCGQMKTLMRTFNYNKIIKIIIRRRRVWSVAQLSIPLPPAAYCWIPY